MDREARKLAEQLRHSQPAAITVSPFPTVNEASVTHFDYCQIQVRLLNGSVIKEKFKVSLGLA